MCRLFWLICLALVSFSAGSAFAAQSEVTILVGRQQFGPSFEFRIAVMKGFHDDKDLYDVSICGVDHADKSQLGSVILRLKDVNGQTLIRLGVTAFDDDDLKFKRVDLSVRDSEIERLRIEAILEPLGNNRIIGLSPAIDISNVIEHGHELKSKNKRVEPLIFEMCEDF